MRRVLVTGGSGFIGSNFLRHWTKAHPEDQVVNLDLLTYAGNPQNLADIEDKPGYTFVHGDICDRSLVDDIFARYEIDSVVHFAAESHVDRSILGPEAFVQTNVQGTFTLLETARQAWATDTSCRFVHVSTDEVYGSLGPKDPPFSESSRYMPNSPYSASKAGSDHFVRAYHHTFGLPAIITNCSNNYGPYQYPEKLIPLCIINSLFGQEIPVYGDGQNVRDWLHVFDHCQALDLILQKGVPGGQYTIGGENEWTNVDIIRRILDIVDAEDPREGSSQDLIRFVRDRPGHDRRYAMNASRLRRELGWSPEYDFDAGLQQTVHWYLHNREWWEPLRNAAYDQYYARQYGSNSQS